MNFSTISVVTGCFMVLVSSFLPGKEKAAATPQNFDQHGLAHPASSEVKTPVQ